MICIPVLDSLLELAPASSSLIPSICLPDLEIFCVFGVVLADFSWWVVFLATASCFTWGLGAVFKGLAAFCPVNIYFQSWILVNYLILGCYDDW